MLPLWCPKPKWWTFWEIAPYIDPKVTLHAHEVGKLKLFHILHEVTLCGGGDTLTLKVTSNAHEVREAKAVSCVTCEVTLCVVEGTLWPSKVTSRAHARWGSQSCLTCLHVRWLCVVEGTLWPSKSPCMHVRWGSQSCLAFWHEVTLCGGGDTSTLEVTSHAHKVGETKTVSCFAWGDFVWWSGHFDPQSQSRVDARWLYHTMIRAT